MYEIRSLIRKPFFYCVMVVLSCNKIINRPFTLPVSADIIGFTSFHSLTRPHSRNFYKLYTLASAVTGSESNRGNIILCLKVGALVHKRPRLSTCHGLMACHKMANLQNNNEKIADYVT